MLPAIGQVITLGRQQERDILVAIELRKYILYTISYSKY